MSQAIKTSLLYVLGAWAWQAFTAAVLPPRNMPLLLNIRVCIGDLRCIAVNRKSSVLASMSTVCMTAISTVPGALSTLMGCILQQSITYQTQALTHLDKKFGRPFPDFDVLMLP